MKRALLAAVAASICSMAGAATWYPTNGSVVFSASWAGGSWQGPGTWVRDLALGDGDGQSALTVDGTFARIGNWDGTWRALVYRYAITPGMIPAGEQVATASFTMFHTYMYAGIIPASNLSLSAVSLDGNSGTSAADYTGGTQLQNDLFTPAMTNWTWATSSAAGNTALVNFINSNYAAASSNGTNTVYLTMRVALAGDAAGYTGYGIWNDRYTSGSNAPTLDITTAAVPEPATLGLLSVSGLMLLRRRHA